MPPGADTTTDLEAAPATIRARMTSAGLSEEKAHRWLAAGDVVVDGQRVTDSEAPAPAGSRWLLNPR